MTGSTKYILITSGKGGSGKSTIADELMYSFERTGTPAAFVNLDPQQGSAHDGSTASEDEAEVVVVDAPAMISDDTPQQMKDVDLIILPVRPSVKDQPQLELLRLMARNNAPDKPVLIVQLVNRFRASCEFQEWLESSLTENELFAVIPQTEQAIRAAMDEKSAMQYDRTGRLAVAYWKLGNIVRRIVGLDLEPAPVRRDGQPLKAYEAAQTDQVGETC